ncbi:bifunctional diguanylate cyclase/phosphodiesterase [Pseudomonas sp. 9Ag]|uniref:putative bifunctional diguanylate cyclase/phosphodiesterase n=1 Tax=Pseudomonas sp. 9Ag TaxID=2653167 RepID=UPI0012F13113|nr:EAL domain-containing protein [Pseudomonas sp. 9Ag]VXC97892.1 GGDEF-domain containing protein [Pseudomonas sp. 9Ag]
MPLLPSPRPSSVRQSWPSASSLVIALTALLVLVWLLSSLADLNGSQVWFPLSLHITVETFSIVVAGLVFAVAWHSQQPVSLSNPLLACAFLAIALLDLAHMLSYRGMPVWVTPASAEKAIAFWLVSRVLLAFTLLAVACRLCHRSIALPRVLLLSSSLGLVVLVVYLQLFQPQLWPRTFIDGEGLTRFKVQMEWLIISLFALAAWVFWRAREVADRDYFDGMLAATLVSILAELCFTAYSSVNSFYSLLGHLYKIVSYGFIYQVVFVSSVRAPYERLAVEMNERIAAQQRADYMAHFDSLTGLPNLSQLEERTRQAMASALKLKGAVAVLYVDLDHFKMVNDSFGRTFGDQLLCTTSVRLQQALPDSAMLARAGGDEFVVLLADLETAEGASAVIQRVLDELADPFMIERQQIVVSISIGVAVGPSDGMDFPCLLRNAEMAMYKAKEAGRRTWCYYNAALDTEMRGRLYLINGLRLALEREEFSLEYQLQLDLTSGRVVGAEALLRWQHPQWGLVAPGQFIPAAEQSGLIVDIGEWVILEACRQAQRWQAEGLDIPRVAVNVAAIQLHQGALEQTVAAALARTGLPASALELELTESSLVDNTEQVMIALAGLKALGVTLSIDDFGTGYSCLAYLRRLSVDTLKIDRSFVSDLPNEDGHAIVAAIIHMAESLGLSTLAEGVEDEATAAELRRLGCRQAQGFFYARPVPASALPAAIASLPV